jgi:hypothetical protein
MAAIENSRLEIQRVADHPGRRSVSVEFDLVVDDDDPLADREVELSVSVRGVESEVSPTHARTETIARRTETFRARAGRHHHNVVADIHRHELDVDQDWWSAGPGGEVVPIAEWVDHLVATVRLLDADQVVDEATTPVVVGSWGALGHD